VSSGSRTCGRRGRDRIRGEALVPAPAVGTVEASPKRSRSGCG
jgi:hypothetical protein